MLTADVIKACMASCHVPLFLDGRPFTEYRGEQVMDGSFWYFVTKDRVTGLPLPNDENVTADDIFWIDYGDDEEFMQTISGNFLDLVSAESVPDMIEAGYNFMKREHFQGRLPMAIYEKPNFVGRWLFDFSNILSGMPQFLRMRTNVLPLSRLPTMPTMPTSTDIINRVEQIPGSMTDMASTSFKWLANSGALAVVSTTAAVGTTAAIGASFM